MMSDPAIRVQLDRLQTHVAAGQPGYAFLEGSLPGDALARIVRDQGAAIPRMVIFPLATVDEIAFTLARGILMKSEMEEPEVAEPVTIDLLPGRTILTTRRGADPVLRSVAGSTTPSAHQWRELEALKRVAQKQPRVSLGELGFARVIQPRKNSGSPKWMQAVSVAFFVPVLLTSPLWAFKYSPLRKPMEALSEHRRRKRDEEWRRKSPVAASLPAPPETGTAHMWAFPAAHNSRKRRGGKRGS